MIKLSKVLSGLLMSLTFMSVLPTAVAGSEAGNGGDFREMQFVSLGYEALDLMTVLEKNGAMPLRVNLTDLGKVLRTVRVKFVDSVTLNDERRSAANFPVKKEILVDSKEWQKRENAPEEKFQLVLHELLPVVGVSDQNYVVSAPILLELRKRNLLTRLRNGHLKFAQKPVLLYSDYWSSNKTGITGEDATAICNQIKYEHDDLYFFVYCEYLEKSWAEKKKVLSPVSHEVYAQVNGTQTRTETVTSWQEYEVSEERGAYGLRVYGWALVASAPWKIVASSLGLGDGMIDRTFASEREAYRACRERLAANNFAEFYRAICRSPKVTGQAKYYYEIVTQNPKVK